MNKFEIKLWSKSVVSGALVGIGVIVNLLSGNKYIGSMLFSVALLAIIHNGLPLYTGKIGYARELKATFLLQIIVFNFIGSAITVFMMAFCKHELLDALVAAAQTKFSYSFLQLFFLGALCGVMMLLAVYSKNTVITVFCIMVFILSGFEHCIADFPFLIVNFSAVNAVKFLCIVLGNSAGSIALYEFMRDNEMK